MAQLITTLGPKNADELGMILPHEHIFVDLRKWHEPGYAQGSAADVVALISPEIEKIKALGITALVEATPVGVGRRVDAVKAVSEATNFPIAVATGIYREPWIPAWAQTATEDELYNWLLGELSDQIETTGVQAAWIKL
ncbi:MAG: esterase, partial [Burkholderiales bacterium]|nr:esterase [Anaerolineae bacterium]